MHFVRIFGVFDLVSATRLAERVMEVRWQLIRSFETSLASQNENLELRKLVARARSDRDALKAANAEKIKKFGFDFLKQMQQLRDELIRMKKAHGDGLAEHENYMTKVNGRLLAMSHTVSDEAAARLALHDENQRLKFDLERVEKELADVHAIKGTDAQRNTKTIEDLRAQLGEADTQNKTYTEKIESLETQVKNEVLTRESLSEEVKRLRLWVAKMEEKGLIAAAEAEEQKHAWCQPPPVDEKACHEGRGHVGKGIGRVEEVVVDRPVPLREGGLGNH